MKHNSANEQKTLMTLLRLALAGPLEIATAGQCVDHASLNLQNAQGRIEIPAALLKRAAAAGLVKLQAGKVAATSESRTYVKRHLAGADEAFMAQHGLLATMSIFEGEVEQTVRINLDHSPLAALARLKDRAGGAFLTPEALTAGERLHADFTHGQLQPRVTQTYEPRLSSTTKGGRGGMAELSDSAVSARLRVTRALDAIGPELSGVALDVCCFMKGLETVERERQWPARSAKLMLKTALLALHRHYEPPRHAGVTRHWGEEGFRPSL